MGVSKNRDTPKSWILIGFSIINHPFWGTSIFGNTYILKHEKKKQHLQIISVCHVLCHLAWWFLQPLTSFTSKTKLSRYWGIIDKYAATFFFCFRRIWLIHMFAIRVVVVVASKLEGVRETKHSLARWTTFRAKKKMHNRFKRMVSSRERHKKLFEKHDLHKKWSFHRFQLKFICHPESLVSSSSQRSNGVS